MNSGPRNPARENIDNDVRLFKSSRAIRSTKGGFSPFKYYPLKTETSAAAYMIHLKDEENTIVFHWTVPGILSNLGLLRTSHWLSSYDNMLVWNIWSNHVWWHCFQHPFVAVGYDIAGSRIFTILYGSWMLAELWILVCRDTTWVSKQLKAGKSSVESAAATNKFIPELKGQRLKRVQ